MVAVLGSIRCSVCDSSKGNQDCVTHPPAAQLCEDYDYCIAVAKYTNDGKSNSPLRASLLAASTRYITQSLAGTGQRDGSGGDISVYI